MPTAPGLLRAKLLHHLREAHLSEGVAISAWPVLHQVLPDSFTLHGGEGNDGGTSTPKHIPEVQ